MTHTPLVLLAFANEQGRYLPRLSEEMNGIEACLQGIVQQGACEVVGIKDASVKRIFDEVQNYHNRKRLTVFHYGGHADQLTLLLKDEGGDNHAVQPEGLFSFLGRRSSLELVFLNGCFTEKHAQALVREGVPLVIGTTWEIKDDLAANFALRFYGGLANGENAGSAYLDAANFVQTLNPETLNKYRRFQIPSPEKVQGGFPMEIYYRHREALEWRLWKQPELAQEYRRRLKGTLLEVIKADISRLSADAIVDSCDQDISMTGGVGAAIRKVAGEEIMSEIKNHYKIPLAIGEVAITSGGKTMARYIFHACMLNKRLETASQDDLHRAVRSCLLKAEHYKVRHIAFPALGTGVVGIRFRNAANAMLDAIQDHLSNSYTNIEKITIALYEPPGTDQAQDFIQTVKQRLES